MSDRVLIESSDSQHVEILWRVASLSDELRSKRTTEVAARRGLEGPPAPIAVSIHGSILRKLVDLMTITVDDPDATAAFIGDNRAILFQLALSSMKLEIPTITEILRAAISRAIKGKATDAIRAYFCIAETQEVVFSEEDEEGFELVASVIDRERTHRLPHSADRDSLVTACYFCKLEFSMTLRKHHCRKCFRVFCNNCANELVDMPDSERERAEALIGTSALTKVRNFIWVLSLQRNPLRAARLCSVCVFEQNQDVRVAGTHSVFQLCRFELPELMALRGVCRSWQWAAEMYVTEITSLRDTLPTRTLTKSDTELLWSNRLHFVGHNRWLVQLLRTVDWADPARAAEACTLLEAKKRNCECKLLRCAASCQQTLTSSDVYELFVSISPIACPKVRNVLVSTLRSTDIEELRCYLPGLVRALADEPSARSSALFSFLLDVAGRDVDFGVQLYWALHVSSLDPKFSIRYGILRDLYLATLSSTAGLARVQELLSGMELVDIVRQCTSEKTLQETCDKLVPALARAGVLSATQSVRLPVSPLFEAVGLSIEGVRRLDSHVAPTILPFLGTKHTLATTSSEGYGVASTSTSASVTSATPFGSVSPPHSVPTTSSAGSGHASVSAAASAGPAGGAEASKPMAPVLKVQGNRAASFSTATAPTVARGPDSGMRTYQTLKVAFKKEDMRKDWIVQSLLAYMHRCLSQDGIDAPVLTYRVLPTSNADGLVEWVPDAMTLTEIEKTYHKSIQNFLVNNNDNVEVIQVRRTFMKSLAASMIMTFLLLVGDRHKENMMIHRSGTFFHVDYGYVLGEDPKPLLRLNLALKSEMIDALGGEGNPLYLEFRQFTAVIYNSLRKRAPTIISMMMLLLRSLPDIKSSCNVEVLEAELATRFAVGRTDEEAEDMLRHYMNGDLEAVIRGPLHDRMHEIPRNVQQVATKVGEHVRLLAGAAAGLMSYAADTASRHLPSLLPSFYPGGARGGPVPDHPYLAMEENDDEDLLKDSQLRPDTDATLAASQVLSDESFVSERATPSPSPPPPPQPSPPSAAPQRVHAHGSPCTQTRNVLASNAPPQVVVAARPRVTEEIHATAKPLSCSPATLNKPIPPSAYSASPVLLAGLPAPPGASVRPGATAKVTERPPALHSGQLARLAEPATWNDSGDWSLPAPIAPPPLSAQSGLGTSPRMHMHAPASVTPSAYSSSRDGLTPLRSQPAPVPAAASLSSSTSAQFSISARQGQQQPSSHLPNAMFSQAPVSSTHRTAASSHLVALPPPPAGPASSHHVSQGPVDLSPFDLPLRPTHGAPLTTASTHSDPRGVADSFFPSPSSRAHLQPSSRQAAQHASRVSGLPARNAHRVRDESGSPELSDDNFEDTQDSF